MEIIFSQGKHAGFVKGIDGKVERESFKSYLFKEYSLKEIHTAKLVHGDVVLVNQSGEGDGIIITEEKQGALIYTADCFSVVIHDTKKPIAGIFHSGWKGTEINIVGKGIQKLRELGGKDLSTIIFPAIHKCCFEIGSELIERFTIAHIPIEYRENKIFADLKTAIKKQINNEGVTLIEDLSLCTCCDTSFYSYRRDKTTKRNLSFVILDI